MSSPKEKQNEWLGGLGNKQYHEDTTESQSTNISSSNILRFPQRQLANSLPEVIPTPHSFVLVGSESVKRTENVLFSKQLNELELSLSIDVEDGFTHPGQRIIEDLLSISIDGLMCIREFFDERLGVVSVTVRLLKCLGHIEYNKLRNIASYIVRQGLSSSNTEIREASVRAIELWGSQDLVIVLTDFVSKETSPWLVNYINGVISDLSIEGV